MPYVSINERVRLYYEEKGEGPPLLFIHPPGLGHVIFRQQEPLARHFRLILCDMRGNGRSSPSDVPITVPLLADDVSVLLRFLGIERAIICGYSNGGSIALDFALRYPQYVEQVILIGGFPEVCTPLLYGEFLLGISAAKLGALSLISSVLAIGHATSRHERKLLKQYVRRANKRDLDTAYRAGLVYCCTRQLSSLQAPLLLIYGARDYYIHPYIVMFRRYVPHADVVFIDRARHQIPTKHSCELNNILRVYSRRKSLERKEEHACPKKEDKIK
ncbi:alpha/beta hydrolase [Geobacillus thermodenitrificans]|jgi:pimeloyl-ACP methyl ester carboxylesterase|uniref:alpha/beta fold hydrolase n=1 Tax=Geobacillus thermodenitrificans TaxID=33940 RepID=UPI000C28F8B9|nr:alpha/beta hydrolase [Geobacillus thermodenitrificans]MEC5188376.1 pimeloyl-ACP methyl ester carboxylesterase [Geobacillus thermodenitrificans]PJW21376.1 hydrolase [Geobacillus thermodenitrificans]